MKSKYTFTYTDPENGTKLVHKSSDVVCRDVVSSFYYFLRAVSFTESSILDAFEDIAEEHRPQDE